MFEIGNSLREARLRHQLDFPELEQQTKIRSKYLKALEDEEFEVLPAPTYVRSFLRSYADALGLEGQLYVDEYNSRFITGQEDVPLRPRDYQRRPQPMHNRFESRGVLIAVAAISVVFALVIAAWKFGSANETAAPPVPHVAKAAKQQHRRAARPYARLVLTGTNGSSWVRVQAGDVGGPTKFEGTIGQGQSMPFTRRPFLYRRWYVSVGKPQNVVAQVNGRVLVIPGSRRARPTRVLVTPRAILKAPPPA